MRKLLFFVSSLFFGLTSIATGEVSVRVCLADGNTPLEPIEVNIPIITYPDIMVGTKLTVIVDSNVAGDWYAGALVMEEVEMLNRGRLYGRDFDGLEYPGSCLPAAGELAAVWATVFPGHGFEFYPVAPSEGDWFIFDYNALDVGDCNIEFYDLDISTTEPIDIYAFYHVPSRDFNKDTSVDFIDFEILASYWQEIYCEEPNWCEGTDLDGDTNVDLNDLMLFVEYWLARTE